MLTKETRFFKNSSRTPLPLLSTPLTNLNRSSGKIITKALLALSIMLHYFLLFSGLNAVRGADCSGRNSACPLFDE